MTLHKHTTNYNDNTTNEKILFIVITFIIIASWKP